MKIMIAPQKTTENTTTFLAFTKNSHLKLEETLKIDKNIQKVLLAIKRNKNHFLKSKLMNFQTHKKSCGY